MMRHFSPVSDVVGACLQAIRPVMIPRTPSIARKQAPTTTMVWSVATAAAILLGTARAAERIELAWPTANTAWADGKPTSEYLQHAGSGDPESGGFGGVRTGGTQFHEGIDIKCVARDRRRETLDSVFC